MNNSLFKKVGASFVALTLAFSCTSAVSATGNNSEFTPSVTYSKGDYTFGKISHPDKAQATTDGLVDYLGDGKVAVTGQDPSCNRSGRSGTELFLGCCWLWRLDVCWYLLCCIRQYDSING